MTADAQKIQDAHVTCPHCGSDELEEKTKAFIYTPVTQWSVTIKDGKQYITAESYDGMGEEVFYEDTEGFWCNGCHREINEPLNVETGETND